jgi:succinate dehydrogenase hydrophobic anchor subunit
MTWWGYILTGFVWVAVVVVMFVASMDAAKNAVAAELVSDFNKTATATAVVSAVIFAGPGLYFILSGVRKKRAHS